MKSNVGHCFSYLILPFLYCRSGRVCWSGPFVPSRSHSACQVARSGYQYPRHTNFCVAFQKPSWISGLLESLDYSRNIKAMEEQDLADHDSMSDLNIGDFGVAGVPR